MGLCATLPHYLFSFPPPWRIPTEIHRCETLRTTRSPPSPTTAPRPLPNRPRSPTARRSTQLATFPLSHQWMPNMPTIASIPATHATPPVPSSASTTPSQSLPTSLLASLAPPCTMKPTLSPAILSSPITPPLPLLVDQTTTAPCMLSTTPVVHLTNESCIVTTPTSVRTTLPISPTRAGLPSIAADTSTKNVPHISRPAQSRSAGLFGGPYSQLASLSSQPSSSLSILLSSNPRIVPPHQQPRTIPPVSINPLPPPGLPPLTWPSLAETEAPSPSKMVPPSSTRIPSVVIGIMTRTTPIMVLHGLSLGLQR